MSKCIAIILSGGIGSRLGNSKPKQYHIILDKPVVIWSILQYQLHPQIDSFIIVADTQWHSFLNQWIIHENINKFIKFATPGFCRQASVRNGMMTIAQYLNNDDFVIIQDAARPCCTLEMISDTINAVQNGADGAVVSAYEYEGHFRSDDGIYLSTEVEGKEYIIQSPDCYRWGKYYKIVKNASDDELLKSRGCQQLAIKYGLKIKMVLSGGNKNPKLTTMSDWAHLEFSIKQLLKKKHIIFSFYFVIKDIKIYINFI